MPSRIRSCTGCDRSEKEVRLHRCHSCRNWFCRRCELRRYGRAFCSKDCAEIFFFGDGNL